MSSMCFFFFQAEDGIRDGHVTGVQTCALPIFPELGGKFDAIPGQRTHTWFKADRIGTYSGRCGEFCGVFHAEMRARVVIESQDEYEAWVRHQGPLSLGRNEWMGVCAKCHGPQGEGDYGPQISNNSLLIQTQGLEQLLRNGRGKMPPVARGWNDEQLRMLEKYLDAVIYKGQRSGG